MTPAKITLAEVELLRERVKTGGLAEARIVYDELAAKGYGYAGWAGGVARGDTITGVSALDYLKGTAMMGLSAEACLNLSPTQIDKIRLGMAGGYLDTLAEKAKRSDDVLTEDVNFKETKAFHIAVFEDNDLNIHGWTLDTPMELIRNTQGDAAVEAMWAKIRDTGGTGPDALVASATLANAVGRLSFSSDPELATQAQAWMDQTPGFANIEQIGKSIDAAIASVPDFPYSDPMGTGDASAIMNAGTNTTSTVSTGTPFRVDVAGVNEVASNIAKVTQEVLGTNATLPVEVYDQITGELTGYKVTSFDGDGATGGLRTTVIFDKDGNLQSGESQVLVNGKVTSQPLDADTAARLDTGITPSINIEIKDTAPTTAPTTTSSVTSDDEQDPEIPTFVALTPTAQLPADQVFTIADAGNGVVTDGGTSNSYGGSTNASTPTVSIPATPPSLGQATDLALLSSDAYNEGAYGQGSVPPGWVRIEVEQPAGAAESGFHATAYKNELTGQVVIAYAGTNDMKDITGSDFDVLLHNVPAQTAFAIKFAEDAAKEAGLGDDLGSITYTGHSLGGGLAQLVAEANNAPAMTFNAPGMTFALSPEDQANAANQTNITNVNLQLDVVSAIFSPTSGGIGNTVTLPASTGQGLLMAAAMLSTALNPALGIAAMAGLGLSQHGIGVVLEQLGQTHNTENINGWERDASGQWLQRSEDGKSPPSYANPEMQAKLDQTRDNLVELNTMVAGSQDRIGQTQAYNSAVGQIQNDFFAEKLTFQNTPDGPILIDQDGVKVASVTIYDDGSILVSAGNKNYSVSTDGKNSDGTIGAKVVYADEPIVPTAEVPESPTVTTALPVTVGTGSGSIGDALNKDSLEYPTYGGGDVIISDDGFDPIEYVETHDSTDISSVDAVNGSDLASDQTRANIDATNTAGALGLMNSFIGLQNWDDASDLSHVQTVVGFYNQINSLAGLGMPPMGGLGAGLGFIGAVQNGDFGGIVVSGIGLGNAIGNAMDMGSMMVSEAIGGALGMSAVNVIPGLNLIIALTNIEENPLGVVIAALAFIPVYGQIIAAVLSICQALFTPAPISEGEAHATFDDAGNFIVTTDSEKNGGGSTANHWMTELAKGAQMAGLQTPQAGAAIMGMPTVGYRYNPEGFNDEDKDGETINGHLTLRWVDPNGVAHARVYTGDGNGALAWGDEKDNSIGEDFFLLMQDATKRYPPLAYEQIEGGVVQFDYGVATVVYATNTHKFDGMAEHTQGGDEDTDAAQDAAIEIAEGDKRLLQDHSNTIKNTSTQTHFKVAASNLHTVVAPIIAPIQTKGDLIGVGSNKVVSNAIVTRPLGFVPLGGTDSLAQDKKNATAAMIKSADNGLFGANNIASTAMAAAAIIQWPSLASAGSPNATNTLPTVERRYGASDLRPWDEGGLNGIDASSNANKAQEMVRPALYSNPAGKGTVQQDINAVDISTVKLGTILGDAPTSTTNGYLIPSGVAASSLTGEGAQAVRDSGINADLILTYPKVTGELVVGTEDTGLRFSSEMLLANDGTDNGRAYGNLPSLRISAVGSPTHGQVALKDGQVIFIPDVNFHGTATFRYTVTDQFGMSSVVTASIYVEGVNDAPITAGESATANEDNIQVFSAASLLANDWDEDGATDGQILSIVGVQDATHGTVALENGQIKFTPATNYHGSASFTYLVSDGITQIPATVNLTVTAVNDAPVTQDEAATGDEDVVMVYSQAALLANDTDVDTAIDGDVLRISRVSNATNGTVTMDANGDIRFVPDANFHGQASYTYWVSDGQAETPATLHITVNAINDAPVTADETATASEDATLMFTSAALLANDSDVDTATDGDVLSISRVGQAEHGLVFLDANGDVRFVPEANYNGPASYTYWVSDGHDGVDGVQPVPATVHLNILQVNDLPVVTGEVIASDEDVVLSIAPSLLLTNDRDIDTDATLNQAADALQTLTISAVGGAQHGTVALLADGTVQFTPELNYFGAASFTYTVDDGVGGQVQATAVVNLAPVNDAPDVVGETININEDEIQTISTAALLANDSDVDNPHTALRIVAVDNLGAATHGTVTLNANGTISYVPDADYFGPAQFTYTVSDGAGGFNVGTADLNIAAVNDAPRLQGESTTTDEDQILHISKASLLTNDLDVDNPFSALSITGVSNTSHGTAAMVGNEIVFTPDLNYNGAASFSYTVSDGVGGGSLATVSLTINSINDVPVVNDELLFGKRDHAYTLSQAALLSNDTDVETPRTSLTIVEVKNVQNGTATLNADHSVTFVPNAGYAGRGTFEYVVQDADGGQSTGTSYIDFSAVNINPIAVNDSLGGYQDAPSVISTAQLLANDSDPDGTAATTLTVDQVGNAQNGTVSLGTDGNVTFTPTAGFYGTASFGYRANDGEGGTTWATGFVTVQKANSAPVFTNLWGDNGNTLNATSTAYDNEGAAISTSLVVDPTRHWGGFAAYDPDGDAITYSVNTYSLLDNGSYWTTQGVVRLNYYVPETAPDHLSANQLINGGYPVQEQGRWQYVANFGNSYDGLDYFQIIATDSHGASTTVTAGTHHKGAAGGGGCFPVVVDTTGNGIDLVKPEDSKMFADINKDGWRDQIGWAASTDAVLGYDANMDGKIDQTNEVSFTSYLDGAKTDLEGLAAFDTDGDGKITSLDAEWSKFGLVQDANNNGKQDEGEFVSLDQQGIVSIDLHREGTPELNNGNVVFGTTTVTYADGRTTQAGDVMFAGKDVALPDDVQALLQAEKDKAALQKEQKDQDLALERLQAEAKAIADKEAAELLLAQELAKAEAEALAAAEAQAKADAEAKLLAERAEELRLAEVAAKEAAEKLAAEQAEQLAIQQAKEAAETLAAAQAAEAAAQALAAQQAAEAQAAAEAAAKAAEEAAKEAALAEEAEMRRQALLFNQMVNTSVDDHPALGFVPNHDAVTGYVVDPTGTHTAANEDLHLTTPTLVVVNK
jgi:Cadherin-like domain/Bacterial Ig domain